MFRFRGFYYAPDEKGGTGSGGGGNADSNAGGGAGGSGGNDGGSDDSNAAGNGGSSSGQSDGGTSAGGSSDSGSSSGDSKVVFTPEQQAAINAIVAKETGKAEARGKKAAADAAATEKAKEEGRFKDLHDALEARVKTEFEPAVEREKALALIINTDVIDVEIKTWPASLKEADPGPEDPLKRLEWVKKHRKLAKDLAGLKEAPDAEHGGGSQTVATGAAKATGVLNRKYRTPGAAKK